MVKKILLVIVCVLLAAAMLAGCNESYKTKAIPTDTSDSTVTSNGGLAVRYGKYLYYINGYAGNEVDNTFGEVQKGAIARVELDQNGNPLKSTNTVVVSKNVYNTTATSGLYISGGYLFYSTPSIDKDSKGEPKIAQMWLMKTKLDGTDTKVVKKFDDYTVVYQVVDGYVLYVKENELHAIDTNSKKFTDTKIDEEVNAYVFPRYQEGQNDFVNSVFYLKAADNENSYHNVLWYYRAGGEPQKVLEANAETYGVESVYPGGFKLTLVEAVYAGDKVRLIYNKTDQGTNKTSEGTYSYDFDTSLAFLPANEIRYAKKTTYKNFRFLNNDTAIVSNGNNVDMLYKEGADWARKTLIPGSSEVKVLDIEESDNEVSVYYLFSNVVYRIPVLQKTVIDNTVTYSENIKSSSIVFDGSFSTSWLSLDLVGNTLYYFNSDVLENTYYLNLNEVIERDADSRTGTLLGIVTAEDEIALLTSDSAEAE